MITVFAGLVNLQSSFTNTFWDIISSVQDGGQQQLQDVLFHSLAGASTSNLQILPLAATAAAAALSSSSSPWDPLRSAMFESIRLAGGCTGPGRYVNQDFTLPSQPLLRIPKGSMITLSPYAIHRDTGRWGADASTYRPSRFVARDGALSPPPIGKSSYVTWGLEGPHICPGMWFAQAGILIMTRSLLQAYEFRPQLKLAEDKRYIYTPVNVQRAPVAVEVVVRQ